MVKKATYNLNYLAKSVFELEEPYDGIIRLIYSQGGSLDGISQTKISQCFAISENPITRDTVNKKIFGTKKTMGLIPTEYLVQKRENKKETSFHLTFKGLFGALASGVSLKKIPLYKNYLKAINYFVKDKKIRKIINEYTEKQIQVFLLWHHLYGIQLKRMTTFQTYFFKFFDDNFLHVYDFGIKINPDIIASSKRSIDYQFNDSKYYSRLYQERSKKEIEEIKEVFSSFFCYKGLVNVLRINGQIPTSNDFLKPKSRFHEHDTREDFIFDNLIDRWPIYIESFYKANTFDEAFSDYYEIPDQPNVKFLPQAFNYEPNVDIDKIERKSNVILIPNVTNRIKTILQENEIDVEIPDEFHRPINVYPF